MKAYEVTYDVGGSSGNRKIVFVEHEDNIPDELAKKDCNFEPASRWSKIIRQREVLITSVPVKELSVGDLLKILGK